MTAAAIRVHQVALRVPDHGCTRAFTNDLQDALRTASWPSLPGGAQLHIRRLRLGRLPAGLSRQALSRLLTARLAETGATVLRWPTAECGGDVVVIPDSVQSTAFALRAALNGHKPHWAVTEVFPDIPWSVPQQAAPQILTRLIAQHGLAAPGRLALLPEALPLILRTFRIASAAQLANWIAMTRPLLPEPIAAQLNIPPEVLSVRPSETASQTAPRDLSRQAPPPPQLSVLPPALRPQIARALQDFPAQATQMILLIAWCVTARAGPQSVSPVLRRWQTAAPPVHGDPPDREPLATTSLPPAPATRNPQETSNKHPVRPPLTAVDKAAPDPPQRFDQIAAHAEFAGTPTPFAGLWLLLPLLQQLDIPQAEIALGSPLCARVLAAFAERLGLPETDPSCEALPEVEVSQAPVRATVCAPAPAILRTLSGDRPLRLRHSTPGHASIALRHGPPGLGIVDATRLADLRRNGVCFDRGAAEVMPDISRIVQSLMLAVQVLAHRRTGQGWRRFCCRPGHITVSATHLDITFDGCDADPAVRIAGLDCDPGWVSWLGRVVSFHYDYRELRDWHLVEGQHGR